MATVAIHTLGCRANRYDSDAMALSLASNGYELVEPAGYADVHIINTCTVTHRTDRQDRQVIYQAKRANPHASILVTGCYAQVSPEEVGNLESVAMVVGNSGKPQMAQYVAQVLEGKRGIFVEEPTGNLFEEPVTHFQGRTRAALKIQDGCNYNCSFCIIPKARGRARSLAAETLLHHAQALAGNSFEEVVLTGIHLGDYGKDLRPRTSLTDLVRKLGDVGPRIRISSLDPHEVPNSLIEQVASTATICRHLHVCLQSGDDGILREMRRHYDGNEFATLAKNIQGKNPDIAIGTDVIVGFPGETESAFDHTYQMIDDLPLAYLHVFPFSIRKGTHAETLPNRVDPQTIQNRTQILLELGAAKRSRFYARALNREYPVLAEGKVQSKNGWFRGFTDNYLPVHFFCEDSVSAGKLVNVKMDSHDEQRMLGHLV